MSEAPIKLNPSQNAAFAAFFEKLRTGICPHCDLTVEKEEQVGHCVYARPCGHRLYQGTVGAFRESPPGSAR
jgi:hypothetical protein